MHLALVIDIEGTVDQESLNRLRTHLNLAKRGRLTDDWDQEFGSRKIERSAGKYLAIDLFRNFDETWKVQVLDTDKRDPNDAELTSVCAELVGGITAAGFRTRVRARPTFGSAAEYDARVREDPSFEHHAE